MTDINTLDAEIAELRLKASKRRNVAGFTANVEVLEARIRQLETERAAVAEA